MNNEEQLAREHNPLVKKILTFAAILSTLCLITLLITIIIMQSTPAYGTITPISDVIKQPEKDTKNHERITYSTSYYSIKYPASFEPLSGFAKNESQVDLLVLDQAYGIETGQSIRLNFSLEKPPIGGITEMTPYKLSQAFPEQYVVAAKTWGTDHGYMLTRFGEGSFKNVLWPHGQYVLVISISLQGLGSEPDYDAYLDPILSSIVWKS